MLNPVFLRRLSTAVASQSFGALHVAPELLGRAGKQGVLRPTPVQAETITAALKEPRRDVVLRGQTGSGKTHAYLLPTVSELVRAGLAGHAARGLGLVVVVPTRELAHQVYTVAKALVTPSMSRKHGTDLQQPLVVRKVVGKPTARWKESLVADRPHIAIGTPAALAAAIPHTLPLGALSAVVLDEADLLASSWNATHVASILSIATTIAKRPQVWLVGATYNEELAALREKFLVKPRVVDTTSNGRQALPPGIRHLHLPCESEEHRFNCITRVLAAVMPKRTLLFAPSAEAAEALAFSLETEKRVAAGVLLPSHFNTVRANTLKAFAAGRISVLVCVDGASRGLDFADVDLVLNLHPPQNATDYVHRVGRTARQSSKAASHLAVTLTVEDEEVEALAGVAAALDVDVFTAALAGGELITADGGDDEE